MYDSHYEYHVLSKATISIWINSRDQTTALFIVPLLIRGAFGFFPLLKVYLIISHAKIQTHLNIHYDLSQDIEYVTVLYSTILYSPNILYSRTLLFIQSIYNTLHLLTATSKSILPAPLGNLSLFSISVSLLDKDSSIMLRKVILTPGFYKGFLHMSFQ